jgi:hypothetical protein
MVSSTCLCLELDQNPELSSFAYDTVSGGLSATLVEERRKASPLGAHLARDIRSILVVILHDLPWAKI